MDRLIEITEWMEALFAMVLLFGTPLVAMCLMIYRHFKTYPTIRVDKEKIRFGRERRYWKDLEKITFTGKQEIPCKWVNCRKLEGAGFVFKDGTEKFMLDDMYSNTWRVKLFIEKLVLGNKEIAELQDKPITTEETAGEQFEVFKEGTRDTKVQMAISLIAFTIVIAYGYYRNMFNNWDFSHRSKLFISFIIFIILSVLAALLQPVYFSIRSIVTFQLSPHFLIVKNPFSKVAYRLEDIREVVLERDEQLRSSIGYVSSGTTIKVAEYYFTTCYHPTPTS